MKKNSSRNPNSQSGFTIIELMIATTVFSVALLLSSVIIIQISRMYIKGVIASKTQTTARNVIDDISRSIQFSGSSINLVPSDPSQGNPSYFSCLGNTRYTILPNTQVDDSVPEGTLPTVPNKHKARHALWKDTVPNGSDCKNSALPNLLNANPSATSLLIGVELLEKGMRIGDISITPNAGTYFVKVTVVYGDDDLLVDPSNPSAGCKGGFTGSQWCAVSSLSTQVFKRVQ